MSEFNLADLAGLDTTEVAEVRFETLAQGVFEFEITNAELGEGDNKDGEKRFWAEFVLEVKDVKTVLDRGVDKDSLIGKKHTEKLYIVPAEWEKGVGRIRAWLTDTGLESAGALGQLIEAAKGHLFTGKITHQTDKDDKSIKYARLRLDAKKK